MIEDNIQLEEELQEEQMYEHYRFEVDKGQSMLRIDKYITNHMEHFLDKLSRYHILNNLIPGITFLYIADSLDIYSTAFENVYGVFFIGYISGMVLSRLGSILIEPWFKYWKIITYAPYIDFLKAEQKDNKIKILIEENNMFRTLVTMFILVLLLYTCSLFSVLNTFMHTKWATLVLIVLLLLLYVLSYRKQTSYIRKRVENVIKNC
jgi:hypothetical protein